MTAFEHLGHKISLNWDKRFQVTGPLFEQAQTFDTYAEAVARINMLKKLEAKEGVPELKLEVIPVDEPDRTLTIRGIHGSTSQLLFTPPMKDDRVRYVYPVAPFVRDLLKHQLKLAAELKAIDKILDPMSIPTARGYGRVKDVTKLIEMVNALKSEYDKAHKLAYAGQEERNKKR
jgi:hypothetical protein